jgi:hypothetical protein
MRSFLMTNNEKYPKPAEKVRDLFRKNLGEFRPEDFFKVADLIRFHAIEKHESETPLKPRGENYLPDIIGTNLKYAMEAYQWNTLVPMTQDGVVVSDFWDREKEELPAVYEMEAGGRFLRRAENEKSRR